MTTHIFTNFYAYFTLIGAFAFGLAYNRIYEHYRKAGKTKPYTAIAVVVGCASLLLISGLFIGLEAMLFLFALFAAAGAPMTLGDFNRAHAAQQKELKEEIKRLKDRRGPRDWPNFAKAARDETAEDLNKLTLDLTKTLGEPDPLKLQNALARALIVIHTALRRLESVGAPTQPPQL